jgi:hypothetical protein
VYFYRIEKVDGLSAPEIEASVNSAKSIVAPLFHPDTETGRYLADRDRFRIVDHLFGAENVLIVYAGIEGYRSCVDALVSAAANLGCTELAEGMLLVLLRSSDGDEVVSFLDLPDDDTGPLQRLVGEVARALKSDEPISKVQELSARYAAARFLDLSGRVADAVAPASQLSRTPQQSFFLLTSESPHPARAAPADVEAFEAARFTVDFWYDARNGEVVAKGRKGILTPGRNEQRVRFLVFLFTRPGETHRHADIVREVWTTNVDKQNSLKVGTQIIQNEPHILAKWLQKKDGWAIHPRGSYQILVPERYLYYPRED